MKKILAGLLASASLLAMSVSASAATSTPDKTVTKAGELTYEVAVTAPKVVLNLVMPAKMTAALNPYGADLKLDAKETPTTTNAGIASVAYQITNKSKDYGVYIDATAITTITTSDKANADKTPAWKVTGAKPTAGTKGAQLGLVGAADVAGIKTLADAGDAITSKAQADATTYGALAMDSSVAADKAKGIVAGQTKQSKVFYVKANDGTNDGTMFMALIGNLAKSTTGANASEVVWNEDDAINVNLVLKVTAGPKTFPTT